MSRTICREKSTGDEIAKDLDVMYVELEETMGGPGKKRKITWPVICGSRHPLRCQDLLSNERFSGYTYTVGSWRPCFYFV